MSEPLLKDHFTDDWYKFTAEKMDEGMVSTILGNGIAPDNCPHESDKESFVKACSEFMQRNGDSFVQALEHLRTRKE